jgi:hypothetical protein
MKLMRWMVSGIGLIRRRYLPSYLVMNLLFYGSIAVGMATVMARPEIQARLLEQVNKGFASPTMSPVTNAYRGHHVLHAAALTLAVNLVAGTMLVITLPSLVVPFFGIAFGIFRGILWGLIFGPTPHGVFHTLATHWPVMLLEGQGYVLGMLGVYIHGKAIIQPRSVGAAGRVRGYQRGLVDSLRIYPLIVAVLAISALYEALEVAYFMHG